MLVRSCIIRFSFLLLLAGVAAGAQQRREALRVLMQLSPQQDGAHAAVTIRIFNLSPHTVNLLVPGGVSCQKAPGTISLEWKYKGDTAHSSLAVQSIETLCPSSPGSGAGGPELLESGRLRGQWMHFRPGQYAEIHDTVNTQSLVMGKYEVRAVYTSPKFDADQKSLLRYQGIETPRGEYSAEP